MDKEKNIDNNKITDTTGDPTSQGPSQPSILSILHEIEKAKKEMGVTGANKQIKEESVKEASLPVKKTAPTIKNESLRHGKTNTLDSSEIKAKNNHTNQKTAEQSKDLGTEKKAGKWQIKSGLGYGSEEKKPENKNNHSELKRKKQNNKPSKIIISSTISNINENVPETKNKKAPEEKEVLNTAEEAVFGAENTIIKKDDSISVDENTVIIENKPFSAAQTETGKATNEECENIPDAQLTDVAFEKENKINLSEIVENEITQQPDNTNIAEEIISDKNENTTVCDSLEMITENSDSLTINSVDINNSPNNDSCKEEEQEEVINEANSEDAKKTENPIQIEKIQTQTEDGDDLMQKNPKKESSSNDNIDSSTSNDGQNDNIDSGNLPKKNDTEKKLKTKLLTKKILIWSGITVACLAVILSAVFFTLRAVLTSEQKAVLKGDFYSFFSQYESAEQAYLPASENHEQAKGKITENYKRWVLSDIKKGQGSEKTLNASDKLIESDMANTDYYFYKSKLLFNMDDLDASAEACKKAVVLAPDNFDYNEFYAVISEKRNDGKELSAAYLRLFNITGDKLYLLKSNKVIPSAPMFTIKSGEFDDYFKMRVAAGENSIIVFTVDGTPPRTDVAFSRAAAALTSTVIYKDAVNFSYYANGKPILLRAVAVDKTTGAVSYETVGIYKFNIEYRPVESIGFNRESVTLLEGDQYSIRTNFNPVNASNKNLKWTSSDENFATVDENGIVTAVDFTKNADPEVRSQLAAKVNITATALGENKSANCEMTVTPFYIRPSNDILQTKKYITKSIEAALRANAEAVGWAYMPSAENTPFMPNDPIFQNADINYYMNHNAKAQESKEGALFVSSATNMKTLGKNTVIHGRALTLEKPEVKEGEEPKIPDTGSGNLFTSIATLNKEPSWYCDANNHYVYFSTGFGDYVCQIFSWYAPSPTDDFYYRTEFSSAGDFTSYLSYVQSRNTLYNLKKYDQFIESDCIVTFVVYDENNTVSAVMHAKIVKYRAYWGGYYATSRTYQNIVEEIDGTDEGETNEKFEDPAEAPPAAQ